MILFLLVANFFLMVDTVPLHTILSKSSNTITEEDQSVNTQTRVPKLSAARESIDSVQNNEKSSKIFIKLNTQIQGEEMVIS
jgi:hypothetical protein